MKTSSQKTGNKEPGPLNLAGIRVLIDPGHGLPDPGAVGPGGLTEQEVVLDVALRLETLLKEAGVPVTLSRRDNYLAGGFAPSTKSSRQLLNQSLAYRVKRSSEVKATHFLSIHCNGATAQTAHGFEVFHNTKGTQFGQHLYAAMKQRLTSHRPRRVQLDRNLYVLRKQPIPAALVELEFISNPEQEAIFRKSEARAFYAKTLAAGVLSALGKPKEARAN